MEQFTEGESTREEIKNKLRQNFDGKIVRKDLTKKIKERCTMYHKNTISFKS